MEDLGGVHMEQVYKFGSWTHKVQRIYRAVAEKLMNLE